MNPVDQTRLYDPENKQPPGNCFQACVASILEISLSDIPDEKDFWEPGKDPNESWAVFWEAFGFWLEECGIGYIEVSGHPDGACLLGVPFIATGPSPRDSSIQHAVVMSYRRVDDQTVKPVLVHDPHPSRDGLFKGRISTFGFFVK